MPYLKAALICFGICVAVVVAARAETSVMARAVTSGAGFDAGYGVYGEHIQRIGAYFGIQAFGSFLLQKKSPADSGYKWGVGGQARGYLGDWYAGGGIACSGYDSRFDATDDHPAHHWRKHTFYPTLSAGLDDDMFDVWATYYFQEGRTVNQVQAFGGGCSAVLWQGLKVGTSIVRSEYLQAGKEKESWVGSVSIGWQF